MDLLILDKKCQCGSYSFIIYYGGEFTKCQGCGKLLEDEVKITSCKDMFGNNDKSYTKDTLNKK